MTITFSDPVASARMTCGACPVQVEGTLTDGRHYYFRARGRRAQLGIGASPDAAVEAIWHGRPEVSAERQIREDTDLYGAGYIDDAEASKWLAELLIEVMTEADQ